MSDRGLETHLAVQIVTELRRRGTEDRVSSKVVGSTRQAGCMIQHDRGSSNTSGEQRDGTVMTVEEHNATLADTYRDSRGLCAHKEAEALGPGVSRLGRGDVATCDRDRCAAT